MKFSDKCILAVVALSDCHEVMAARIHLSVGPLDVEKITDETVSMYLRWHFQHPPLKIAVSSLPSMNYMYAKTYCMCLIDEPYPICLLN